MSCQPIVSLSKRAFAQRHSVSEETIQRWVKRGLPTLNISNRKLLFPVAQCDRWIIRKFLTSKRTPKS